MVAAGVRMSRGKRKTPTARGAQHPRRVDGLEINPVEDGFMIYQPETDRVHYLNHTAVLILEMSNGRNTPAQIATLLQHAYGLSEPPEEEVNETLVKMTDEGLIRRATGGRKRRNSPRTRRR
jgi:coenzyme PQQ synthesis protein D (PqqD)